MAKAARYVVGIDLGTTHTVVAYADTAEAGVRILDFAIPQQIAPGEVASRPLLASARFHAAGSELPELARELAAPDVDGETIDATVVVGEGALALGAKSPSRLVTSAKSWLSHAAVDRHAAILPWGSPDDIAKTSPVDASASYLRRVRNAWDVAFPSHPLATQEVVLTVPASFDEVARNLTLDAAVRAGLGPVRLVEEPTAAFHGFLDRRRDGLEAALDGVRLVLVADVGGGTTDLTLIRVEARENGPRLTRIAVGDHLMLGGDNVDHALAHLLEGRLSPNAPLGPARHLELVQRARQAKELLLGRTPPESARVSVLGSGSRLIGGTLVCDLERAEVERQFVDGFFPEVDAQSRPAHRRSGLVGLGLPYVADPAITRHLVAFLARHERLVREALGVSDGPLPIPDAVLFNGGMFHSPLARARVLDTLTALAGRKVRALEGDEPDRAVAHGAAAYGLSRRGVGVRVFGGSSRSFFLRLDEQLVCVLPRGSEEGESITLPRRSFSLKLGKPVSFRIVSTTADVRYVAPGDVEAFDAERYDELPPIAAVLGSAGESGEVRVELSAGLTEVGTLELSLVAVGDGRRFKLEFQTRGKPGGAEAEVARITKLHPRFAEAVAEIRAVYGKASSDANPRDVKRLRIELERILGPRETWDTPLLRELFAALLAGLKNRRRSADHERVYLNLIGYCLRPGFGFPLDAWRVAQLAPIVEQEIQFVAEPHNWSELWTAMRRIAGGLPPELQEKLADKLEPALEPKGTRPKAKASGPKRLGVDEMTALVGALEHLAPERKTRLGNLLVERIRREGESPRAFWSLSRLGARVPVYGSAHRVVPRDVAAAWLELCLAPERASSEQALFAAVSLARVSGDRARDLEPGLRERVATRLASRPDGAHLVALVREATRLDAADERRVFGDSLPPGLRLVDD